MMKKVFVLLLSVLLSSSLFAVQMESINIEAVVPEDYSIVIPDAVAIDRLLFEVELESGEDVLLEESDFSLGELSEGKGSTYFSLLYYGNLASDYDVVIKASSSGLYSTSGEGYMPIDIEVIRDDDCIAEIETTSYSEDEIHLVVPPMGAMEAEPVVKFIISWDSPRDLPVGRYEGSVDVELRSF